MNKLYIFIIIYAIIALLVFTAKTNNVKDKMTALAPLPTNTTYYRYGCYNDTDTTRTDALSGLPRAFELIWTDRGVESWKTKIGTPIMITTINNPANATKNKTDAVTVARLNGYTIFGVQSGGFLFLGNDIKAATKYGPTSGRCFNNTNFINMSGWSNEIWWTTPEMSATAPDYNIYTYSRIGCYNDKESRAIPNGFGRPIPYLSNNYNQDGAVNIAAEQRATVFGVQYGGQFFYGKTEQNKTDAIKYGKVSNELCQDNLGRNIPWQNDVWVLKSVTPLPPPPTNAPTAPSIANNTGNI